MHGTVAVNGEVRRLEELRLQDFLQGFQFGAGFFETLLVTEGAPMFLCRHLARLRASLQAHAGSVEAPPADVLDEAAVRDALRRCLEADAALGPRFTGVAKLVASDGRLLLTFRALPGDLERTRREGRAIEALEERTYRRGDRTLNHKSLAYLRQHAQRERMPLFRNEAGEACETPTANLFLRLGDALVTPPLDAPCLPGIARAVLLGVGRVDGLAVRVRPVGRADLAVARGAFLTNSVGLALPVPGLLGRALPESLTLAAAARAVLETAAKHDCAQQQS
ncbi:aminotransferase class IV [Myxococcaceae bacterium GXIMD 01537]